ncbi:uncharacterized protein KY384_005350 [Bacidia gigantensis]|uniref:uncharacterized protein n=1 Tax=Bacidia gigantensis TaxID=2732470 RepID=UPI001D0522C8|nr:uncharacterized protein KY384_005350 [Bacidia gigantensis]KAG8529869.1 hypothetical protein KY384_005350 [Bacidia gigantensis]
MPPKSLLDYVISVRKHSLARDFHIPCDKEAARSLPRHVAVGMKPKKIHEVQNFARYLDHLCKSRDVMLSHQITHFVDFGSGQNYLGRTLASPPYDKLVIALESKPHNIAGAQDMDIHARLTEKVKTIRNKKLWRAPDLIPSENVHKAFEQRIVRDDTGGKDPSIEYCTEPRIKYVETVIKDGSMSEIVETIRPWSMHLDLKPQLMVVSLHSCGNLIHHGLRSLVLNPAVKAVAMVGCCYNLVTERLGPPTYKLPSLRTSNPRLERTTSAYDPHGFPMSERLSHFRHSGGEGIRFNITARMMACQAPQNWTEQECESFFTRHFYRALLQRILLDHKIVGKPLTSHTEGNDSDLREEPVEGPAIIIGSLRKQCYQSFVAYVRGAIQKMANDPYHGDRIRDRVQGISDEEIKAYEERFGNKKKELSILWSLMAFSAILVESVIVVDRWMYLKEQDAVKDCWVEPVFEYGQSPRNLVVVGIKN